MADETIDDSLYQLKKQMELARETGLRGKQMAQRIEGDLMRLMNSGWLNLSDLVADHERQTGTNNAN